MKKILPLSCLLLFVNACGEQTSELFGSSDSELIANWIGTCDTFEDPNAGTSESERTDIVINDNTATVYIRSFRDKDCKKENVWLTKKAISKYEAGKKAGSYKQIDMQLVDVFVTAYEPGEVTNLNDEKECGLSNWKVGVDQKVTGKVCDDKQVPKAGEKAYDIYKIKGNTIKFGLNAVDVDEDSDLGRSPENRPTELYDYVYKK